MKVSIIILNWNGKKYISECLDSVISLKHDGYDLEMVVVDNASTDGSLESVYRAKRIVNRGDIVFTIIENKYNLGFTGGNNVGIKYVLENGADYILILNSDTIVDKNLVNELIGLAKSKKEIGIVGAKIYFAPGYEYQKNIYKKSVLGKVIWYAGGIIDWNNVLLSHRGVDEVDKGQFDSVSETDFVTGCCLLIKSEVLVKIGLFDDKYYLYLEDSDLCQRARIAGYKVLYNPKAVLWHMNAGSSSVGGNLHDYFLTRNRLLFGIKYTSVRTRIALVREAVKIYFKGRSWQKIAVKDAAAGKFGVGSWK